MTKEQIEGNKLIAEFCGWTIEPGMENSKDPYYNQPNEDGVIPQMVIASNLRYHSSWDWIMQVVEKIKSIGYNFEIVYTTEYNVCRIYRGKDESILPCCIIEPTAFEAIVKFVTLKNKIHE